MNYWQKITQNNKKFFLPLFLIIAAALFAAGDWMRDYSGEAEKSFSDDSIIKTGSGAEIFGMKIENINIADDFIKIVTTGAEFRVGRGGVIECWQKIPERRKVAEIKFDARIWPLEIFEKDEYARILSGDGLEMEFSGDSLIVMKFSKNNAVNIKSFLIADYEAEKNGKKIFIDSKGGFGVYPVEEKTIKNPAKIFSAPEIRYEIKTGDEIWFSVFSPRSYNWTAVASPLAHTGKEEEPYSPEELIKDAARHAKVFTLHSFFMPGGDKEPWLIPEFAPSDMKEFLRVRDQVHENGMKFVIYASPYYSTAPDFFGQIDKLINEYGVDGVYYDGISFDFRESYEIIKKTRLMLGDDKIIYVHASTDPFNSTQIYAPFIDAYADYVLRGESGRPAGVSLEKFLRYTISGYNISGAAGYWLHYGSANAGQSEYLFNLPDQADIELALANHVYFPWSDTMYRDAPRKQWLEFTENYFDAFKRYLNKNIARIWY